MRGMHIKNTRLLQARHRSSQSLHGLSAFATIVCSLCVSTLLFASNGLAGPAPAPGVDASPAVSPAVSAISDSVTQASRPAGAQDEAQATAQNAAQTARQTDAQPGVQANSQESAQAGSQTSVQASDEAGAQSGGETRKLSLEESVKLALANNKIVLVQKQEVERMNGQVTQARATALPTLTGDTQYLRTKGSLNFGGSEGITFDLNDSYYTGNLNLIQPIYTAGRVGAAMKAAKAARGYAQENLQGTLKEVTYAVKASFGAVLLARQMADLAKESLDLAQAHLTNVEQLYKQGVASEYELIRARVQVAQYVPAQIKADNELERALIVYRNTLGLSADEKVEPVGALERKSVETTVPEAFALALKERNEVAAAQLRVQGMKAALDIAKAYRYPSLSFEGNANMQTDEPQLDYDAWRAKMWSATIDLSIPIFDGLLTKGKIKQSKAEYEQARLLSEQTLDEVRLEVEQAVSKLAEARKLVESQVASVGQAQKGLDIANIRYKNGVGTQLEVLDAQVAFSTAKASYFTSVYEHFMAVAELERATGATFD